MATRRRSMVATGGASNRISLNPELEKAEIAAVQAVLGDPSKSEDAEYVWYSTLSSGSALRHRLCGMTQFKSMMKRSGICTTERDLNSALSHFDDMYQTTGGASNLPSNFMGSNGSPATGFPEGGPLPSQPCDVTSFLRALIRFSVEKNRGVGTDYVAALTMILKSLRQTFVSKLKEEQNFDPSSSPDESFLEFGDVDQVLYVYDTPLDKLFKRYRAADGHENRELSLEQATVLDQFVELDELREFMKEFSFFPKVMSWVEMSLASQMACFGEIMVNPTKQGAGRQSGLNATVGKDFEVMKDKEFATPVADMNASTYNASTGLLSMSDPAAGATASKTGNSSSSPTFGGKANNFNASVGTNAASVSSPLSPLSTTTGGTRIMNPLYVEMLPPEYQCQEVLLDKARFMSCFVRLAQMLYNKPEYQKVLPTVASRVEEMLRAMKGTYEKIFGHTMEEDCDYAPRGVPSLSGGLHNASLNPPELPHTGGTVTIFGNNFCEKRGCFVMLHFVATESAVPVTMLLRCKEVQKKRVQILIPLMAPEMLYEVNVDCSFCDSMFVLSIFRSSRAFIEATNDRVVYSQTVPQQCLTIKKPLPKFVLNETMCKKILRSFSYMCAVGQKYNSRFLVRNNWKKMKAAFEIRECPNLPLADERELFFVSFAELHDGAPEFSLDFRGFLRCCARAFFEMKGEDGWMAEFERIADIDLGDKPKLASLEPPPEEKQELALAREALQRVEKRLKVELDVFMGPVLCGSLTNTPGSVVSEVRSGGGGGGYGGGGGMVTTANDVTVWVTHHSALSYHHYDNVAMERVIMEQLEVSLSFLQAIQRLFRAGFDFAAKHCDDAQGAQALETLSAAISGSLTYRLRRFQPAGRCWRIFPNERSPNPIGAMWDYGGQLSLLEWQPAPFELRHKNFSVCFYCGEEDLCFLQAYVAFHKICTSSAAAVAGNEIRVFQEALTAHGMVVVSKLFASMELSI